MIRSMSIRFHQTKRLDRVWNENISHLTTHPNHNTILMRILTVWVSAFSCPHVMVRCLSTVSTCMPHAIRPPPARSRLKRIELPLLLLLRHLLVQIARSPSRQWILPSRQPARKQPPRSDIRILIVGRQNLPRLSQKICINVTTGQVSSLIELGWITGTTSYPPRPLRRTCTLPTHIQPSHLPGHVLISLHLLPPPIKFLLNPHRITPQLYHINSLVVIEPRTIAPLPLHPTAHTKLSHTATRHMVTALLELDHGTTIIAGAPALLLRYFR